MADRDSSFFTSLTIIQETSFCSPDLDSNSEIDVHFYIIVNNLAYFVQQKCNFFQRNLTPLKFLYVEIYVPRTPQKKFEANRSGGSLHFGSLLFSRFYLLKRWFLTFSEVKFWSFGGSNFGCETIQTSSHTYILKIGGPTPKILLDSCWILR